jgi:hypothetical protein
MSVIPFNNLRQADDFFSVFLSTANAHPAENTTDPTWLFAGTNQGIMDRYKHFKRCWGVVDYVNIPRSDAFPLALAGSSVCLRMYQNQQPNSFDSLNGQSNVIYMCMARKIAGTETSVVSGCSPPTNSGFPFEVMNPFGNIQLGWTLPTANTALQVGRAWEVKITYYFYKE